MCSAVGHQRHDTLQMAERIRWPQGRSSQALKELEHENQRLRRVVADQTIDISILKVAARGNF
jgi:hypothetical protein